VTASGCSARHADGNRCRHGGADQPARPGQGQQAVAVSGYKGERTVLLIPSDFPTLKALGDVGADMLQRIGINVDTQYVDWGSMLQRLAKTDPVEQGGWSIFHTYWSGLDQLDPAVHVSIRGTGRAASLRLPTSARLDNARRLVDRHDTGSTERIAAAIQVQVFEDVPYIRWGRSCHPPSPIDR